MSYAPPRPGLPPNGGGQPKQKGSVKAARERLAAMQSSPGSSSAPELSRPPPEPILQPQAQLRGQSSLPQLAPTPPRPVVNDTPQWPLKNEPVTAIPLPTGMTGSTRPRGPPPPRPPRPSFVQSLSGPPLNLPPAPQVPVPMLPAPAPPVPMPAPTPPQPVRQAALTAPGQPLEPLLEDDNSNNSRNSRPLTVSSRASTNSSLGPIPDFPVPEPEPPAPARRPPALGRPPSARRGPSSYYGFPGMSFVSPIKEESESRRDSSRKSFASSNVIPNRDMSGSYFLSEGETPSDEEEPSASAETIRGIPSADDTALVRSASLGKRSKPTLTTIQRTDSQRDPSSGSSTRKVTPPRGAGIALTTDEVTPPANRPTTGHTRTLSTGTRMYDSSSDTSGSPLVSDKDNEKSPQYRGAGSPSEIPLVQRSDTRVDEILAGLRKGGALDQNAVNQARREKVENRSMPRRLSKRNSIRNSFRNSVGYGNGNGNGNSSTYANASDSDRAPPANNAKTRASMSLPELLRLNIRAATVLDSGKTASTYGTDWMNNGGNRGRQQENRGRESTSLADMLASFPPPGWATPQSGDRGLSRERGSALRKPSPLGGFDTALPASAGYQKEKFDDVSSRKRRVCGMSLTAFIIVMILLVLLVAAAVTIPIGLIIIPRQRDEARRDAAANALAVCEQTMRCLNGGNSIVNQDATCGCVCSNGFTGRTCATADLTGCTSIAVQTTANATVGDAIPRVVDSAQNNFNIPLNVSRLLVLFSANSLSCSAENALVTFNNAIGRRVASPVAVAAASNEHGRLHPKLNRREPLPQAIVQSSEGVLFATPTNRLVPLATSIPPVIATASRSGIIVPTAATSVRPLQPSATAPVNPQINPSVSSLILDFARTSVLFVFQSTGSFERAVNAQSSLQSFFVSNNGVVTGGNVTLVGGFLVDLTRFRISLVNGSFVGRP